MKKSLHHTNKQKSTSASVKQNSKWNTFCTWSTGISAITSILSIAILAGSALYAVSAYKETVRQNAIINQNNENRLLAQEKETEQLIKEQEKATATQQVFNLAGAFAPYRAFLSRVNYLCDEGKDMTEEERESSGLDFQFNIMMVLKQMAKGYLISNASQSIALFGPSDIRGSSDDTKGSFSEILKADRSTSTLYSEYCNNKRISEPYVYGVQNNLVGLLLSKTYNNDNFIFKPEDIEAFKNPELTSSDSVYIKD